MAIQTIPAIFSYYKETYRELQGIKTQFEGWKDPLSRELHRWIKELPSVESLHIQSAQEIQDLVRDRVDLLRQKILVNPYQPQSSLQEPVLDGIWVWEAALLKDYQTLSSLSPFTKKPFDPVAQVHVFAVSMIAWASKVAELQGLPSLNAPLMTLIPLPADGAVVVRQEALTSAQQFKLTLYNHIAEQILWRQDKIDRADTMVTATQVQQKLLQQTERNIVALEKETQKRQKAYGEERVAAVAEQMKQERALCQSHLQHEEQKVTNLQAQLSSVQQALAARGLKS